MSASHTSFKAPQVLRIETMSLDLGEMAVVIELDAAPPRAWAHALDKALLQGEGLEDASARFDGRFVYIIGLEPELRGAVQRVSRVLAVVQGRAVQGPRVPAAVQHGGRQAVHA